MIYARAAGWRRQVPSGGPATVRTSAAPASSSPALIRAPSADRGELAILDCHHRQAGLIIIIIIMMSVALVVVANLPMLAYCAGLIAIPHSIDCPDATWQI